MAGQCALTDHGKEWETLESLFDHAIKEETKLSAKDRVNMTDNSPSFSVKRGAIGATIAALPAQQANRPRLERQRFQPQPSRTSSTESYIVPNCPIKYKAWSHAVMDYYREHKTCFKCRDRVHPKGHDDCPFRMTQKQAWGDYSPLHGRDPADMQVDDPPSHSQEPARGSNPYAPQKPKSFGKSTRGPGSASAHKRRFFGLGTCPSRAGPSVGCTLS